MGGGVFKCEKKKKLKALRHCRVPLSEVLHPDVLGGGTSPSLCQSVSALLKNLPELTETSKQAGTRRAALLHIRQILLK